MTSAVDRVRSIVLLGSTGSIGTQAIDVIERNRDRFRVGAIAAGGGNVDLLARQSLSLQVEYVGIADANRVAPFEEAFRAEAERRGAERVRLPEVVAGPQACTELASLSCDAVLNGITGSVGLGPTLAALNAGHRVILANKESLIVGGPLVKRLAVPGQILPGDSEHSAIFQCLHGGGSDDVRRLIVTASGGPFRGRSRAEMAEVTPQQALAHPIWDMGPVITVNCANLVNKGLEVIEAHLLFDIPFDRIEVVVHPQVMVHSMVEFRDGSTLAQVAPPDIRMALALGMSWPHRVPGAAPACDWSRASTWEFLPVDHHAFPGLGLARAAGSAGGTAPAVFNAANEECVAAFLAGRLPFLGIIDVVARVLDEHDATAGDALTVEAILATEAWARQRARELTSRS
jgi:1-deoxy-D-xylulose-5-phosphate reductoisomerase